MLKLIGAMSEKAAIGFVKKYENIVIAKYTVSKMDFHLKNDGLHIYLILEGILKLFAVVYFSSFSDRLQYFFFLQFLFTGAL